MNYDVSVKGDERMVSDHTTASATDSSQTTANAVIDEALVTLGSIEPRSKSMATPRSDAITAVRDGVSTINRELYAMRERNGGLTQQLQSARQQATDDAFVNKLVRELERFTGAEFAYYATDVRGYRLDAVTDEYAATADAAAHTLTIGNKRAGLKPTPITVAYNGRLSADAFRVLAGILGITPTKYNTPRGVHDDLFEPTPEVPEYVREAARSFGFDPDSLRPAPGSRGGYYGFSSSRGGDEWWR